MSTTIPKKNKRIIAIITSVMMAAMVFVVLPVIGDGKVYAVGETAKVTTSLLNVRSGAGTKYSKIGSLTKGKTFVVRGSAKDTSGKKWYKLSYKSKTGYVSSKYVYIIPVKVTVVTNTKGTVKTDSLNVRSGSGTGYSRIGSLVKGKVFTVTGKAKDSSGVWWYRLTYSGKTGYVSSKYIKTATTIPVVTAISNTTGTVKASGVLNVRSGPGTKYSKLGLLAQGKAFTVTGKAKDSSGLWWYRLTYSGKTGYVYSAHVTTSQTSSSESKYEAVTFKIGTVTTSGGVNVRKGAGTGYSKLTTLPKGSVVPIIGSAKASGGKVWYKYQYSASQAGYICSDYVSVKTITSDSAFEAYMVKQGFPESYKPGLRMLHASHPKWVFKAVKVGYNWSNAVTRESRIGTSLISSSFPTSYRSTASGAYNSKTKVWTQFEPGWYAASSTVVAYYMDPRNFINEGGIYQFMTHKYDSASQNSTTVAAVIKGSFMESKNPGSGYPSYASLINAAGKAKGVNPNVLASMIIQEQGWSGSKLVSGTYSGYKGYYNFFNIGAYPTSTMNAVQRGLWYAKGEGAGKTSYSRPWNTPYKSILGGAAFYSGNYLSNKQDSYYTKKFNVKNGINNVGSHQYMTNIAGAASEGTIVKRAYSSNSGYPVVFELPVYNSMPSSACPLP